MSFNVLVSILLDDLFRIIPAIRFWELLMIDNLI